MSRVGWILGLCAALVGVYPALETLASQAAYSMLASKGHRPVSADLIVVFGGGGGGRITKGLDLLAQGFAPKILFLGTTPEMEFAHTTAKKTRDWAPGRIQFGPQPALSTAEGVRHLGTWARTHGTRRALIISDADHLGRLAAQLEGVHLPGFQPLLVQSGAAPRFAQGSRRRGVLREAAAYAMVRLGQTLRPDLSAGLPTAAYTGI